MSIPLFDAFPQLKENLPHISLCNLPTPIIPLPTIARQLGIGDLFVKQDGLSSPLFGGNKVRKLEFILAQALADNAKETLTFGFAGSNHALSVAIFAKEVGLKSISMLMPQQSHPYVRNNLLMGIKAGARFHYYPSVTAIKRGAAIQTIIRTIKTLKKPFIISPGGSSPAGVVGYINAVYEWQLQLEKEKIPQPDTIYIPLGTAGTYIGLLIGFKALGLKTRIEPIRVVDHSFLSPQMVVDLFNQCISFIKHRCPSFPSLTLEQSELKIRDQFLGDGYSYFSPAGNEAIQLMRAQAAIKLDGTYSGKAFAALVSDARQGLLKDRRVHFWNTLNCQDFTQAIADIDYHQLPRPFWQYFQ